MLLNNKNKVIGITYATFDSEDSQNLNYAINVEVLQELYRDLTNKKYILLRDNFAWTENYKVDSLHTFYKYTNAKKIFEDSLSYDFKIIYDTFDEEEKWTIVELYEKINEREFLKYSPSSWEAIDYLINLNVLDKNECAIVATDIYKNADANNVFQTVNNYNLGVFEKAIILLVLAEYYPSDLANQDAKLVVDTISGMNYSMEQKKVILEFLGYTVNEDEEMVYW